MTINKTEIVFPTYRMMKERKVYYKILSEKEFIEIYWIGRRCVKSTIKSDYPTFLRIQDMLACREPFAVLPQEYEHLFDK